MEAIHEGDINCLDRGYFVDIDVVSCHSECTSAVIYVWFHNYFSLLRSAKRAFFVHSFMLFLCKVKRHLFIARIQKTFKSGNSVCDIFLLSWKSSFEKSSSVLRIDASLASQTTPSYHCFSHQCLEIFQCIQNVKSDDNFNAPHTWWCESNFFECSEWYPRFVGMTCCAKRNVCQCTKTCCVGLVNESLFKIGIIQCGNLNGH